MSANVIEKRQNEVRMLRYQYASRSYYNHAEKLNDLIWLCCIISWLFIFFPANSSWATILFAVPFFVDIVAAILYWRMTATVSAASALRKYFDAFVLGLNIKQFTISDVNKLEELSIKAIKRSPEKSKVQMTNTGRDNPPGVRNWYEFSQPLSESDARYECQKQNCWWNKRITQKRGIFIGIAFFVFIVITFLLILITKPDGGILLYIFSSSGLIVKFSERIAVNLKYYMLSLKIDGALEVLTTSRSDENIKNLQNKIDERRSIPVLERNNIHKRHAKEYSELYHDTTTFSK